jgi:hypothetical protein
MTKRRGNDDMKFYVFGCSNTYGFGLADCYDIVKKVQVGPPSKYAFPALVNEHLGFEIINKSECGISNKYILHIIQNTHIENNSLVLVHWASANRWCIRYKEKGPLHMGRWLVKKSKESRVYFKYLWNSYDNFLDLYTYANYIKLYCESKNCKIMQYANPDAFAFDIDEPWNEVIFPKHSIIGTLKENSDLPFALDGIHPGPMHHKLFADILLKDIQNEL